MKSNRTNNKNVGQTDGPNHQKNIQVKYHRLTIDAECFDILFLNFNWIYLVYIADIVR